jgi:hypothetical protein
MIDLYEIASARVAEQKKKGEDTRASLYIPFDKKYKVRKFPTGLCKVVQLGVHPNERNNDKYIVPDYQRSLVWDLENKQNLIYAIMNGSPIGEFIFSRKTIDTKDNYYHEWIIIDGQQRINTLREFVTNKFQDKDGRFYKDYSYREMIYLFEDFDNFTASYIQDLTELEQVKIYLSKNLGGVVHTDKEIQRAKDYLAKLEP